MRHELLIVRDHVGYPPINAVGRLTALALRFTGIVSVARSVWRVSGETFMVISEAKK